VGLNLRATDLLLFIGGAFDRQQIASFGEGSQGASAPVCWQR